MSQGCSLSPHLFNIVLEFLAIAIKQEEIKGIQKGKAIIKVSPSADDMTLYVRDPKNSTQKLLDTINSFSKYSRIQNQLTKLVAFLYTSNKQI
jgi:hypothetical protein